MVHSVCRRLGWPLSIEKSDRQGETDTSVKNIVLKSMTTPVELSFSHLPGASWHCHLKLIIYGPLFLADPDRSHTTTAHTVTNSERASLTLEVK